jgi:hypothetical protein
MAQAIRSVSQAPYAALQANLTINAPAGVQDGDLLLIALLTEGTVTFATLAGWTPSFSNITASAVIQTFYKVASGEPASYTWSCPTIRSAAVMICVSGASGVIDDSSFKTNSNINPIIGTDITTHAPNEVLIWVGSRPNVAVVGVVNVPTNTTLQGRVNAGAAGTTAQMAMGAAVFPSAGITNTNWVSGSLSAGVTANNNASVWTFKDAVAGGQPLMFCEA